MLFRLFDREGLKLVPAVQFSSTLNDLEHQLRARRIRRPASTWLKDRDDRGANCRAPITAWPLITIRSIRACRPPCAKS